MTFRIFLYILGKLYNFTIYDRFLHKCFRFHQVETDWTNLEYVTIVTIKQWLLFWSWSFAIFLNWLDANRAHFQRHENLTILTKSCTINYQKVKLSLLDILFKFMSEDVNHILYNFDKFCIISVKMLSFAFHLEVFFRSVLLLSIRSMFS